MIIKDIYWERVNLHLVLDEPIGDRCFALKQKKKIFELTGIGNELIINVTNTPDGTMLDKGNYAVALMEKREDGSYVLPIEPENKLGIEKDIIYKLEDKSKIFKYNGGRCTYLVMLSITEAGIFKIETNFMMVNYHYKRFRTFRELKGKKKKIKLFGQLVYIKLINWAYKLFRAIHFNKDDKVLFLTENSDEPVGNLKAMEEQLNDGRKKLIYAIDNFKGKNNKESYRMLHSIKQVWMMAKVNTIYVDNYLPNLTLIKPSPECRIIQLWHAGVGFKSVGFARFGLKGSPHPYVSCHRRYTDAIVDREDMIPIYMEVFGNKRSIFQVNGMPRLKDYLSKERQKAVSDRLYETYPILKDKKVLLFAPTYRGVGSSTAYYEFDKLDWDRVKELCEKKNTVCVIKMHPFVNNTMEIQKAWSEQIIDLSHEDINDLNYVSDVMVTDYSSCAYEFSLLNKPLVFYRYDKEIYEYFRPVHTLDVFSKEQYEAKNFEEFMDVLERLL